MQVKKKLKPQGVQNSSICLGFFRLHSQRRFLQATPLKAFDCKDQTHVPINVVGGALYRLCFLAVASVRLQILTQCL